jgi:hypothetical protein
MKLLEELSGTGQLIRDNEAPSNVRYDIRRFQGLAASGLPIPGLFRIEGTIDVGSLLESEKCVDVPLNLRLEDGRTLRITLADRTGRVLSEGHGPTRCLCC